MIKEGNKIIKNENNLTLVSYKEALQIVFTEKRAIFSLQIVKILEHMRPLLSENSHYVLKSTCDS